MLMMGRLFGADLILIIWSSDDRISPVGILYHKANEKATKSLEYKHLYLE